MNHLKAILALIVLLLVSISCGGAEKKNHVTGSGDNLKSRLLITTDIGGDPDDTQSMIRLLVTSNMFDLEGMIASASGTPNELDTFIVRPDLILQAIDHYAIVFKNLKLHHPDFPDPSELRDIVKKGNPRRGLDFIGDHLDTEGSAWIETRMLEEDERPLNICIWGGQTDVYQALHSLKRKLTDKELSGVISNLKIYDINDQDKIYSRVREEFPDLFYILAKSPPDIDKREGVYRGMYLGGDETSTSMEWINTHVKNDHGPLGELYPVKTWTAPNPHGCLKEAPEFHHQLNFKLDVAEFNYGTEIHVILEVKDDGMPPLTSYRRTIISNTK